MAKKPKIIHAKAGEHTLCGRLVTESIRTGNDKAVTCKSCKGSPVFKLLMAVGGGRHG